MDTLKKETLIYVSISSRTDFFPEPEFDLSQFSKSACGAKNPKNMQMTYIYRCQILGDFDMALKPLVFLKTNLDRGTSPEKSFGMLKTLGIDSTCPELRPTYPVYSQTRSELGDTATQSWRQNLK